ncbi:unnamed protein product [Adineta steineri]|uniref:Copper transport protein n=1 Tax=Adineta steineri TaxID=433720 RepID=A0A818VPR3_9BILA|nr:unnamed protein product [Adineta steineri]CAF3714195.1 unnamed protein product [Adineta steineri]
MHNGHDHAAMISTTTPPSMSHDHHAMGHASETSTNLSGHGLHMKDMMMMAMTFHGGYKEQILFDQWDTKTLGAFIGSWFVVFFIAVLYEALKALRDYLSKGDGCDVCSQTQDRQQPKARLLRLPHIIQTFLHILQMTISYGLMLIAMTYNTYLFFAVILGAGFGHFLFAWRRSSVIDYNEHCH